MDNIVERLQSYSEEAHSTDLYREAVDIIEAQQAQIEAIDTEVKKRLREIKTLAHMVRAQQARIAEMREALQHYAKEDIRNAQYYPPEFAKNVLARTDDLSALQEMKTRYEARIEKLLEAADMCGELEDAIVAMAEDGWLHHGPEGMSEAQEKCYAAYLALKPPGSYTEQLRRMAERVKVM